jgi:cytochrome subunit of sulfide dehydrogenase
MRSAGVAIAAVMCGLLGVTRAASSQAPAGAAACSDCHPTSNQADIPVPRLAGRNPSDIVAAMQGFRSGQRQGTIMDRIAKGFSDEEIRAIADWLGAQR